MNLWFNIPFAALMITAGLGAIPDSVIESGPATLAQAVCAC